MLNDNNPNLHNIGLALSGGGAKGFAHLGVFKLLEELKLRPDIISGTSAGALAGALFADGYSAEQIKILFTNREFSEFANLHVRKSGLFDMKPLRSFLKRTLRAKRFEDLKIPLVVVATDLDHGLSHEFRSGSLVDPIIASCSVPIIFSPLLISGVHYVDGGLFRNFPVSTIREECRAIIGVNVSPLVPEEYKQNLLHIAERSYQYLFHANTLEDREMCDVLVETNDIRQYKVFDLKNVARIAQFGYDAAVSSFAKVVEENENIYLKKALSIKSNS